jgi:hypothetical protein
MKILVGDFNAKRGRENIFKPTTRNKILHQDINDNGVRIVNFAAINVVVKEHGVPAPKHSLVHLDLSRWEDSQRD